MGKVPGKPEGYATAPSAVVGGKEINPGRKHANHRFIEIETLAPLVKLEPGQATEHIETWHIIEAKVDSTPAELMALIKQLN